ncbi:hypothetical protein ACQEU3_43315 [Spirillospora sp. CA-253888]
MMADAHVLCPICLRHVEWDDPPLYRYDAERDEHVELEVPADAGPEQRARLRRTARVRCPGPGAEHHLPAAYGEYGPPIVLGLVGGRSAGKTHLLAAMVEAVERGEPARRYGLTCWPVDVLLHRQYLREHVDPLVGGARRLDPTPPGRVMFADAFVVEPSGGSPRVVALFDVAGDDLTRVADAAVFLDAADGLMFVVDPARLADGDHRDHAFGTVLDLLRASGRLPEVSAAVVLAKSDLLRFEDPLALWLRRDGAPLDAAATLAESADVYAYLHRRGAHAWNRPYQVCARATLHVVSATGADPVPDADGNGGAFVHGVRPRRVLHPLVALLAMTGALTGPEAERIGR